MHKELPARVGTVLGAVGILFAAVPVMAQCPGGALNGCWDDAVSADWDHWSVHAIHLPTGEILFFDEVPPDSWETAELWDPFVNANNFTPVEPDEADEFGPALSRMSAAGA